MSLRFSNKFSQVIASRYEYELTYGLSTTTDAAFVVRVVGSQWGAALMLALLF